MPETTDLDDAEVEAVEAEGKPPAKPPASADGQLTLRERIRNSPLGNFGVVAVATVVILAGTWFVNSHWGGDKEDGATEAAGRTSKVELADASASAPKVGENAPAFEARAVDGSKVSLADFKGKPVWLVFNASWCAQCRAEVPDVQAMQEKFGNDVTILSVYESEGFSVVSDYAERLKLTYTQIPDPNTEIGSTYRVLGIPAHYFIDGQGTIQSIDVGGLSESQMTERIEGLTK